jgi:hypothetical protein
MPPQPPTTATRAPGDGPSRDGSMAGTSLM